jgi:hypothetical protein
LFFFFPFSRVFPFYFNFEQKEATAMEMQRRCSMAIAKDSFISVFYSFEEEREKKSQPKREKKKIFNFIF